MAYGNAQRLGQTIDPSLMRADYSGYANAGAILGNTLANVGQQIGETIKINKQNEREIKKSEQMAKSIRDAIPELAPMAENALAELNNPDLTTNQKLAIASGIQDSLKIGILGLDQRRSDQMLELEKAKVAASMMGGQSDMPIIMDAAQLNEQIQSGAKVEYIPLGNGMYQVKSATANATPLIGGVYMDETGQVRQAPSNTGTIRVPGSPEQGIIDGVNMGNTLPVEPLPNDGNVLPPIGARPSAGQGIRQSMQIPSGPVPNADVWRMDRDGLVAQQIPGSMRDLEAQQKMAELEKLQLETQKMQGEQGKQTTQAQKSKDNFSSVMVEASNAYANLYKKRGAVVGGEFSLGQVLASTQAGQKFGEITGSEAQQFRNYLGSLAPKILLGIMASTGLSATQLNSNAELQLQLQSLGDPSKPIQSNLAALHTLDKMYGDGTAVPKMLKNNPELNSLMEKSGFDYGVEESKKSDVLKMFELDPRLR